MRIQVSAWCNAQARFFADDLENTLALQGLPPIALEWEDHRAPTLDDTTQEDEIDLLYRADRGPSIHAFIDATEKYASIASAVDESAARSAMHTLICFQGQDLRKHYRSLDVHVFKDGHVNSQPD